MADVSSEAAAWPPHDRRLQLPPNRERFVREHVWWIMVCAEPDGDECGSGSNVLAVSHRCAAFGRWRDFMQEIGMSPTEAQLGEASEIGPKTVTVPVTFDEDVLLRLDPEALS